MKLFTGWVMSAGLVVTAAAANAQVLAPYQIGRPAVVSDFEGPYAAMPPDAPVPPRYGYGPTLLPPQEVYTVVRDGGFSPLGAPQLRGFVYTIAVIDSRGDDGRLVIDARNGRILRFMPAYRMGDNFREDLYLRPGWASAGDQPDQGRAAATGLDPASRQPVALIGAAAEGLAAADRRNEADGRQAGCRARAAIGGRAGETGGCGDGPASRRTRRRRGQARRVADPADPGNAEGAGAGLVSYRRQSGPAPSGAHPRMTEVMTSADRPLILAAGGCQDQVGDLPGMRHQRQVTGVEFHRGRLHALRQKPLQVGIDGLILFRHRIP